MIPRIRAVPRVILRRATVLRTVRRQRRKQRSQKRRNRRSSKNRMTFIRMMKQIVPEIPRRAVEIQVITPAAITVAEIVTEPMPHRAEAPATTIPRIIRMTRRIRTRIIHHSSDGEAIQIVNRITCCSVVRFFAIYGKQEEISNFMLKKSRNCKLPMIY